MHEFVVGQLVGSVLSVWATEHAIDDNQKGKMILSRADYLKILEHARWLLQQSKRLELDAAIVASERLVQLLDKADLANEQLAIFSTLDVWQLKSACRTAVGSFRDGSKARTALSISLSKVDYYTHGTTLFGDYLASKFSSALYEIDEAGKCLALERSTACVFHLMRTMEIGIRATARCLGIPDPVKPAQRNWGFILGAIKDGIDSRWAVDRQSQDAQHLDSLYASLDAIKNAWRNPTMHVEGKYTPDEAEHIFGVVAGFMRRLASRMDEQGAPLA